MKLFPVCKCTFTKKKKVICLGKRNVCELKLTSHHAKNTEYICFLKSSFCLTSQNFCDCGHQKLVFLGISIHYAIKVFWGAFCYLHAITLFSLHYTVTCFVLLLILQ